MELLKLYTDGGFNWTTKIGACSFVAVENDDCIHSHAASYKGTTSNRMELRGVINALMWARLNMPHHKVSIFSDSQYVVNIPGWAGRWKRKGWRTAGGGDVKNLDLVMFYLEEVASANNYSSKWVRGHSGVEWNEHADELVNCAIDEMHPIEDIGLQVELDGAL